jgi:uncharacterized protein YhaN
MAELNQQDGQHNGSPGGTCAVEARLRHLFSEQRRLRELLERTRAELDQINREVLQVQEDFCTDEAREQEYWRCLQRLLGFDPVITREEIEEATLADCVVFAHLVDQLTEFVDTAVQHPKSTPPPGDIPDTAARGGNHV